MCVQTRSPLASSRRGECRVQHRAAPFAITPAFRDIRPDGGCCRLTAAKEVGATIEIEGKKVALGIPGGKSAATGGGAGAPGIPLGRGATPNEAAAAVLL